MANNQIVQYGDFQFGDLTQTDIQVIHETIAKDCSEPQFRLFMTIAKSLGANPILNEIYPTVLSGKLTPQFGIGFYVKQARKHSDYKGYDVQLVYDNDTFKMHQEKDEGDDGRYYVVIDEHSWSFPRGKVTGCYAFAYREGFKPFSVIMGFEEVEHYQRSGIGMQKTMWTNNLADMFKKHTAKRALNAAFGLSLDEETSLEGQGNVEGSNFEPTRKDVTPEATVKTEAPKTTPNKSDPPIDITPDPAPTQEDQLKTQFKVLKSKLDALSIPSNKDGAAARNAYYKSIGFEFFDPTSPTLEELENLITLLEMKIAEKQIEDDQPL